MIPGSQTYSEREGVYSKSNSPSGNGNSMIYFDFIFSTGTNNETMIDPLVAEIVIVHSSLVDDIGYVTFWDTQYCCTPSLVLADQCEVPNRLIIEGIDTDPQKNGYKLFYWTTAVNDTVEFSESVEPMVSGFWYLIVANCDTQLMRNIFFQGSTIWESPFGYLPAQAYGNLIVQWILAILYFLGLVGWSLLLYKYRQDLHKYQHGVTILIAMSFIEELLWSVSYVVYNNTGSYEYGLVGVAVIFSAGKYTGIRFLLLLMGSGFAITVEKLSPLTITTMSIICFCYFVITTADLYITLQNLTQPVSTQETFIIAALLIVFNATIIIWIVCITLSTMKRAKNEKNAKYPMYRKLLIIFGIICGISIIAFFAVVSITFAGLQDAAYQWYWLLNTYWDWIYFAVTVYIAYVWKPDKDNKRYAYVSIVVNESGHVELEESIKSVEREDEEV